MKRNKAVDLSKLQVLNAVNDDISMELLSTIANEPETAEGLIDRLKLSHRQYYNRISKLLNCGLVNLNGRKYTITTFGKLINGVLLKVSKVVGNSWKLKAIDAINSYKEMTLDERKRVIDQLIDDIELKKIIHGFG